MSVILICGLNGSGKTTLGKELASTLDFAFLNDEEYYFEKADIPFSKSRTSDEASAYILAYIQKHENTVITATRGNLGAEINRMYDCVIYLSAPLDIRLSRIKNREYEKFGTRALPGGDMYKMQKAFHNKVALRTADKTEAWLDILSCPVIRLDGTVSVKENVMFIVSELKKLLNL